MSPRAIQIRNQGDNGSERAKKCFEALRKCFEGKSQFASIKWEEHCDILNPRPALRESCEARAAQIVIDWLRWKLEVERPAAPLVVWLMQIGNPALIKRLDYLGSTDVFDNIRAENKKDRSKQLLYLLIARGSRDYERKRISSAKKNLNWCGRSLR